jgi:dTDP-4-dehydrorhamnose reductase
MKTLLTGGNGLLGKELRKYIDCYAPSSVAMDVTDIRTLYANDIDLVIHAAAYTDVPKAEKEPEKCAEVNVIGTSNVSHQFRYLPLVYISSEYARNPVNFYSWTKRAGEIVIEQQRAESVRSYLIIRTLFKPNPFPWTRAFTDQYTQGDYVDVIAPLIVQEVMKWNRMVPKTVYVGTGRKTMFELAKRTRPTVKPCSVSDIKDVVLPKDYL